MPTVKGFLNAVKKSGIDALKHRWQKCLDTEGDYVLKNYAVYLP